MINSLVYKTHILVLIYGVKRYKFFFDDHLPRSLITWSSTPAAAVAAPILKEWPAYLESFKPIRMSKDLRC